MSEGGSASFDRSINIRTAVTRFRKGRFKRRRILTRVTSGRKATGTVKIRGDALVPKRIAYINLLTGSIRVCAIEYES